MLAKVNRWLADRVRGVIDSFYRPPLSQIVSIELLRYGACGVGNYIVADAVLYFLIYNYVVAKRAWSIMNGAVVVSPHIAAMVILFPITFLIGFWLNRYVTFQVANNRAAKQLLRYAISVAGSIALSYIILKFLVEQWAVWPTPAKVISSMVTATYSYLMAKLFTFRRG